MLGETIALSDFGYFGDEGDTEIVVSPLRTRPVYLQVPDLDLIQPVVPQKDDETQR